MGWKAQVSRIASEPAHLAESPARENLVSDKKLRDVRPIVTNLSSPEGAWIRVELALLISGKSDPKLDQYVAEFISDTTDFLRGMDARQITGANGLRRLRADLLERARFRIGPAVEAVLIQTLVVQ